MTSKLNFPRLIATTMFIFLATCFSACKKDLKIVDEEKHFGQDYKYDPTFPYGGGWSVTLKPHSIAEVAPGGDIVYNGKYKIIGSKLLIEADNITYKFDILSKTEIKEKKYGALLKLK